MARITNIDAMKGYGILTIILIHTAQIPTEYHNCISSVCIPLFFVISGFTIKEEHGTNAIKKKSRRLLIPYFFWGSAITLFHLLTSHSENYIGEFLGLLYSRFQLYADDRPDNVFMLPMKTTSPLWFVTCFYVAILLYMAYCTLKKPWQRTVCIAVYAAISFAAQFWSILPPWSIDTAFLACLFIISGKALKNATLNIPAAIILSIIYMALSTFNGPTNMSIRRFGIWQPFSIMIFYALGIIYPLLIRYLCRMFEHSITVKALAFVGRLSLRIMILHLPIYTVLTKAIACNIVCMTLTIAISITVCYIIERLIAGKSTSSFWAYI